MAQAFIVGAVRTAGGRNKGRLAGVHPADLGGKVLDALVARTGVDPSRIDDVIFGCVSQIGAQSGNIARNCVLSSRLPESVPATSVDRQCGSGQQAMHFAAQAVMSGTQDLVIAGGVESMTRVPIGSSIVDGAQAGPRPAVRRRGHAGALPGREVQPVHRRRAARQEARPHPRRARPVRVREPPQGGARATKGAASRARSRRSRSRSKTARVVTHDADEGIRFDASLEQDERARAAAPRAG